jgi:hypothetical protein
MGNKESKEATSKAKSNGSADEQKKMSEGTDRAESSPEITSTKNESNNKYKGLNTTSVEVGEVLEEKGTIY